MPAGISRASSADAGRNRQAPTRATTIGSMTQSSRVGAATPVSQVADTAPSQPLPPYAVLWIVMLCAIYGMGQITIKIGNEGISPLMQAGLRSIGATVIITAWMLNRGISLRPKAGIAMPALAIGVLFALEFIGFYWGLALTSAARGTILLYTAPFFVALGAHYLLGERLAAAQWLGLLLAFAGIALVVVTRPPVTDAGSTIAGDLLCLGGGIAWGVTTLVIRGTALRNERAERSLLYQLVISAILLIATSVLMGEDLGEPGIFAPTLVTWLALAYQILVVASFGYLSWFVLLQRHSPARLSAFTFLTPLFGVVFAGLILGERLTLPLLGASALCAAGLWLINRR